jgi:cell wall-associated NlpC family hydrolase
VTAQRRRKTSLVLLLVAAGVVAALAGLGGGDPAPPSQPAATGTKASGAGEAIDPELRPRPQSVQITGVGTGLPVGPEAEDQPESSEPSPGAQTDAEVRAELAAFRKALAEPGGLQIGPRAKVLPDGTAVAPANAPRAVKLVIKAGNAIARTPYRWGGGHAGWSDTGYDCSGSVSYALYGAGLLRSPLASGGFVRWGEEGPGEWITIYTNPGHMFMMVAGLRFDTSGRGDRGTRWQEAPRSTAGFTVRHFPGL